uniref:Uncharacterized protein n=1 Tax=Rhizophora mucronata TaxID=61149 RepID=A0A2P2Q203_RHIMU
MHQSSTIKKKKKLTTFLWMLVPHFSIGVFAMAISKTTRKSPLTSRIFPPKQKALEF